MRTKSKKQDLLLLPNSFKFVGIGIIAITIILGIIASPKVGFNLPLNSLTGIISSKLFFLNAIIVGLLLIALAKDKIEDEMTIKIRFQSMAFAFLTGAMQTVISPIIDRFLDNSIEEPKANTMILGMLLMYLMMKTLLKYTR